MYSTARKIVVWSSRNSGTIWSAYDHPINVTGKIDGIIAKKIIGKNGFGYDPIFIPKNYKKTFGQFSKREKIMMDHRFLAFKKLKKRVKI